MFEKEKKKSKMPAHNKQIHQAIFPFLRGLPIFSLRKEPMKWSFPSNWQICTEIKFMIRKNMIHNTKVLAYSKKALFFGRSIDRKSVV